MLLACTSTMKDGDPDLIFPKIIEVINPKNSGISVEITLKDSLYRPGNLLSSEIKFSDKKDKPVTASFTYHLQNNKGDISKGDGKTDKEGKTEIKVPLPAFQSNDNIRLMVEVTYKGNNVIGGIVIPTPYNQKDLELKSENTAIKNTNKQLQIRISTDKPQYRKNEKVVVNINATDNKGGPVVARLSLSVSNTQSSIPWFQNWDIVDFIIHKNYLSKYNATSDTKYPPIINNNGSPDSENEFIFSPEVSKYFAQYLLQITHAPGHSFKVQEQNDIKKISKDMKPDNSVNQYGYTADRNILDIIKQMKPCHVAEGNIVFSTSGIGSINFAEGALIIIDGIKMGTDVQILNTISVTDIAKINISTNPSEIQKYTGLNSSGIIEIFMKKGPESLTTNQKDQGKSGIICWEPDILTESSGKASISFLNNTNSSSVTITVEGVSADGLTGVCTVQYSGM